MITVIESLHASEAEAAAAFVDLARRLAANEVVDPKHARNILLTAGKTTADLEALVTHLRRVAQLRAEIASVPTDLPEQVNKLNAGELERIEAFQAETLRRRQEDADKHGEYILAERRLRMLGERKSTLLKELDKLLASTPEPSVKTADTNQQ